MFVLIDRSVNLCGSCGGYCLLGPLQFHIQHYKFWAPLSDKYACQHKLKLQLLKSFQVSPGHHAHYTVFLHSLEASGNEAVGLLVFTVTQSVPSLKRLHSWTFGSSLSARGKTGNASKWTYDPCILSGSWSSPCSSQWRPRQERRRSHPTPSSASGMSSPLTSRTSGRGRTKPFSRRGTVTHADLGPAVVILSFFLPFFWF